MTFESEYEALPDDLDIPGSYYKGLKVLLTLAKEQIRQQTEQMSTL
jgi:hypothetical protein